jgi:hypothetical protein
MDNKSRSNKLSDWLLFPIGKSILMQSQIKNRVYVIIVRPSSRPPNGVPQPRPIPGIEELRLDVTIAGTRNGRCTATFRRENDTKRHLDGDIRQ